MTLPTTPFPDAFAPEVYDRATEHVRALLAERMPAETRREFLARMQMITGNDAEHRNACACIVAAMWVESRLHGTPHAAMLACLNELPAAPVSTVGRRMGRAWGLTRRLCLRWADQQGVSHE